MSDELPTPWMSRTVWKKQVPLGGIRWFDLPLNAQIVHVENQHNIPTMWFIVENPDYSHVTKKRYFQAFGTGALIPFNSQYIGTAVGTVFVWHIFELFGVTE